MQKEFQAPAKYAYTPAYGKKAREIAKLRKKYGECADEAEKKELLKQIHSLEVEKRKLPYKDASDKKLSYVRYADDFIIGISGNREEAEKVKQELTLFAANLLKLELSDEKTKITHSSENAHFLGYDINVRRCQQTKRKANGIVQRTLIILWNCWFLWIELRSLCMTGRLLFKEKTAVLSRGRETLWQV